MSKITASTASVRGQCPRSRFTTALTKLRQLRLHPCFTAFVISEVPQRLPELCDWLQKRPALSLVRRENTDTPMHAPRIRRARYVRQAKNSSSCAQMYKTAQSHSFEHQSVSFDRTRCGQSASASGSRKVDLRAVKVKATFYRISGKLTVSFFSFALQNMVFSQRCIVNSPKKLHNNFHGRIVQKRVPLIRQLYWKCYPYWRWSRGGHVTAICRYFPKFLLAVGGGIICKCLFTRLCQCR